MNFLLEVQKDSVSNAGAFLAILSTSRIDSQGDRVLPRAFTAFKHIKKPLLVGHDASELPIGVAAVSEIEADRVLVRGQLLMSSPRAQEAAALMKEGVVFLSYRAKVARNGSVHKDGIREISELASLDEVTLTATPANGDAAILAVKSFGAQAVAAFGGRYDSGAEVCASLVKGAGDPVLLGSTFPLVPGRVEPRHAARAGSWLSRLPHEPVTASALSAPRLVGAEGDAAEQVAQNTAIAQVHLSFEENPVTIPNWAASVPCSKQVLDDSPALAALVFDFLGNRLVRQMEGRAASDLLALANAVADADAFAACGELADLGFAPSVILMSPKKVWARAQAQTNSDDPPRIGGLPVLPSAGLTAAQGLAVSFDALRFLERESVAIDIGLVNGQFTSNMRTIRGNARALLVASDSRAVRYFTVA